jgi:hypothetical protein
MKDKSLDENQKSKRKFLLIIEGNIDIKKLIINQLKIIKTIFLITLKIIIQRTLKNF